MQTEPAPPLAPVTIAPSESFTEAVLGELRLLRDAKRDAHRFPEHTLYREFAEHLFAAVGELCRRGLIRIGDTINDKYISITTNQE